MLIAFLLGALMQVAEPVDLSQSKAIFGGTMRSAVAVHPARDTVYADEGGMIAVLDTSDLPGNPVTLRGRVHVDAHIEALLVDTRYVGAGGCPPDTAEDDVLYIAGGDSGFWRMTIHASQESNLSPGDMCANPFQLDEIDDDDPNTPAASDNSKHCMDVAIAEFGEDCNTGNDKVVVLFSEYGGNEIRLYRRNSSLSPLGRIELKALDATGQPDWIEGTAWGLDVDGEWAYVAMGIGGIVRVHLVSPFEVERGPTLGGEEFGHDSDMPPVGLGWLDSSPSIVTCDGGTTICSQVVDVSIERMGTSAYIYLACQDKGLGEIVLSPFTAWNAATFIGLHRPAGANPQNTDFSYITFIDSLTRHVGATDSIEVVASGIRYNKWLSTMNYEFTLAVENQFRVENVAKSSHLRVFRRTSGGSTLDQVLVRTLGGGSDEPVDVGALRLEDISVPGSTDYETRVHTMQGTYSANITNTYRVIDVDGTQQPDPFEERSNYSGICKYTTGGVFLLSNKNLLYLAEEAYSDSAQVGLLNLAQSPEICLAPVRGTENPPQSGPNYQLAIAPEAAQWKAKPGSNSQYLFQATAKGVALKRLDGREPCDELEVWTIDYVKPGSAWPNITSVATSPGRWGAVSGYDSLPASPGGYGTSGSPDLVFAASNTVNEGLRLYSKSTLVDLASQNCPCDNLTWPCVGGAAGHFPCRLYHVQQGGSSTTCPMSCGDCDAPSTSDDEDCHVAEDDFDQSDAYICALEPHEELEYPIDPAEDYDPDLDLAPPGSDPTMTVFTDEEVAGFIYNRLRLGAPKLFFHGDPATPWQLRQWTLAVPAGFNVREVAGGVPNPDYKKAQVTLFDVTDYVLETGPLPCPPTALYPSIRTVWRPSSCDPGSTDFFPGSALNLDVAKVTNSARDQWKAYLFVADSGGRLIILDASISGMTPCLHSVWEPGPSNLDLHYDNVLDVAVEYVEENDVVYAYVGVHHKGIVRLSYQVDSNGVLGTDPFDIQVGNIFGQGLSGVTLQTYSDHKRLLVGCRGTSVFGTSNFPVSAVHLDDCPTGN